MIQLQIFVFFFLLGLSSCTQKSVKVPIGNSNFQIDSMLKIIQNADTVFLDTLSRMFVDDYSVVNEMFAERILSNSSFKKQSGETYSSDKVWFGNDTLDQSIVFELYTDQFRLKTFHFYNKDIPTDLIYMGVMDICGVKNRSKYCYY